MNELQGFKRHRTLDISKAVTVPNTGVRTLIMEFTLANELFLWREAHFNAWDQTASIDENLIFSLAINSVTFKNDLGTTGFTVGSNLFAILELNQEIRNQSHIQIFGTVPITAPSALKAGGRIVGDYLIPEYQDGRWAAVLTSELARLINGPLDNTGRRGRRLDI